MALGNAKLLRWALLAVAAVLAALSGLWLVVSQVSSPQGAPDVEATYLEGGRPIADFQLRDHRGGAFTPQRLQGRWTLLTFGHTRSPEATPETLGLLAVTYRILAEAEVADGLQVAMVTVNPGEDSARRLASYLPEFHPDFVGVTGEAAQIRRLARSMGIRYSEPGTEARPIQVQPARVIALLDPRGQLLALFTPPHHPELLARDVQRIRAHARGGWLHSLGGR
ncbi:SCO family protein [Halorhodospira neutriphila]|uniref:Thioredoxin domain-containing protein n=1 Tax=Halorhodospira neutriphila TaxID=168379 RepID=A0ABS1E4W4_9GAMM|nr:SCO family protein [Halorhodospira neutriphila]MBK1726127.1 hypothetical protein [Halorhodospira neutriphila]